MHFDRFQKTQLFLKNPSATLSQQSVGVKSVLVLLKVVRSNISILPVLDCVVHHCQKISHIFLIGDVKGKEFDKAVIIKQPPQGCRQLCMLFSPPATLAGEASVGQDSSIWLQKVIQLLSTTLRARAAESFACFSPHLPPWLERPVLARTAVSGSRKWSSCCLLLCESKSTFERTLTWGSSRLTMTDKAAIAPDMNLLPSTMKWQSRTKMPQILKFQACRVSTSLLITGMWVYSSI